MHREFCSPERLSAYDLKELANMRERQKKRSLALAMELKSLVTLFSENNIRFIVLKGLPLSVKLYGDISRRPSKDIDILVKEDDFEKMIAILKPGYEIEKNFFARSHAHLLIKNRFNGNIHEIHLRLLHNKYLFDKFDPFGCKSDIINVLGMKLPVLPSPYDLIYFIIHGAIHSWFRLFWLKDLSEFCSRSNFNMPELLKLSEEYGVTRIVASSLITCNRILAKPELTQALKSYADKDKHINTLTNLNLSSIKSSIPPNTSEALKIKAINKYKLLRHCLLLRKDMKYKIVSLLSNFSPSENALTLPLPEKYHFLYLFLHPILACYRWYGAKYLGKKAHLHFK